jgi:hypothetical protein
MTDVCTSSQVLHLVWQVLGRTFTAACMHARLLMRTAQIDRLREWFAIGTGLFQYQE